MIAKHNERVGLHTKPIDMVYYPSSFWINKSRPYWVYVAADNKYYK